MTEPTESTNAIAGQKLFRVNDYEWWAGCDLEAIKLAYHCETGIDPDSDEGFDAPRELEPAALDKLIFTDDDSGETVERTFREQLQSLVDSGATFPRSFASTEY